MMSTAWFSLPFSIPSFSAPLSIQRRFISFVLKRSLGHLVKSGQLDISQIDAQIGNGYVEVKDLELDCTAVNAFLTDLPILLQDGSIGSVIVRIPWPNPFSSTIGLSLNGLHLTFIVRDHLPNDRRDKDTSNELASSVASVADKFIHEELTANEETLLRNSVYHEQGSQDISLGLPGSLVDEVSGEPTRRQESIGDPEGVSIFAGLFERLLARFDFAATGIRLTLLHQANAALVLKVSSARYFTEADSSLSQGAESNGNREKRVVRIEGLKFSIHDVSAKSLQPLSPSSTASLRTSIVSGTVDVGDNESDIDEDTQVMMSQSILSLPLRNPADIKPSLSLSTISSSSASDSMYHSAITEVRPTHQVSPPSEEDNSNRETTENASIPFDVREESLFTVDEPIEIVLITPPPYAPADGSGSGTTSEHSKGRRERMKLSISMGIIAIAARAQNLRLLSKMSSALTSSSRSIASRSANGSPFNSGSTGFDMPFLDRISVFAKIKDIVAAIYSDEGGVAGEYVDTFFAKPLLPPFIPLGYTRLHIDLIELSLGGEHSSATLSSTFPRSSSPSSPRSQHAGKAIASCFISDISLLAFHPSSSLCLQSSAARRNKTTPILIFDSFLADSYRNKESTLPRLERPARSHSHPFTDSERSQSLPDIDVIDWFSEDSREHGSGLRQWKTRAPHLPTSSHRHSSSGLGPMSLSNIGLSTSPKQTKGPIAASILPSKPARDPAILATIFKNAGSAQEGSVKVTLNPVHLFLDLIGLSPVLSFLDAIHDSGTGILDRPLDDPDSDAETAIVESGTGERERQRLKRLVLDDLELNLDYTNPATTSRGAGVRNIAQRKSSQKEQPRDSKMSIEVKLALVRCEIRVPPPRGKNPRSSTLILDLHDARYTSGTSSKSDYKTTRFTAPSDRKERSEEWSNENGVYSDFFDVRRFVVAYNSLGKKRATCLVSLGPIRDPNEQDENAGDFPPVLPYAMFRPPSSDNSDLVSQPKSVLITIPSVHAVIDKESLDGLQLWADDISQWAEKLNKGVTSGVNTQATSRDPSVIGSRYFLQQTQSKGTESDMTASAVYASGKSESVAKASISEVFVRLSIPNKATADGVGIIRRVDVVVSDLDAILEVNPEGKEETVISADVSKLEIVEYPSFGAHHIIAPSSSILGTRQEALKFRFRSVSLPGTSAKESKIRTTVHGMHIDIFADLTVAEDFAQFVKSPPGAFESVVPSERTQVSINLYECALRVSSPSKLGAFVLSIGDVGLSTELSGKSKETALKGTIASLSMLFLDDCQSASDAMGRNSDTDLDHWLSSGYALIATIQDLDMHLRHGIISMMPDTLVDMSNMNLRVHLCADSISGIAASVADFNTLFESRSIPVSSEAPKAYRKNVRMSSLRSSGLLNSIDEQAFRRHPVVGPLPDLINDDLPSNPEYLDASFGAAAGLRPFDDEENEFYPEEEQVPRESSGIVLSRHGGETIRMLGTNLDIMEYFYDNMKADGIDLASEYGDTAIKVQARGCNLTLFLHDGYDWERTRRAIQEEVKRVKRRLAKIRQLLANGQTYNPNLEEVNTVLFNSVYVGLEQDTEGLEPDALLAAIDDELKDDDEAASESSWQSFKPGAQSRAPPHIEMSQSKKLHRSKDPSIEFSLQGLSLDFNNYRPSASLTTRLLFTIKDLEILDHIRTSTWSKFLTGMQTDNRGNVRETDSHMVQVELQMLLPYDQDAEQEARLKAKILPLRLHVDQDALDFLKKFFSFKDAEAKESPPAKNEIFLQHVEVFPVDIKLDYKPRRVDYRALKEGKTIELMNFFHFDGAEMTLRHITLKGITGWPRMFDTLNDLWTPDVKANQLADVISGVSPIRSAVNVGSGVADLILLPIAQYKKDGRIIRGLQKGTTAFVKSTAVEAIRLGARLATGTQVVLEQAESVLGGQFTGPVTAEAFQTSPIASERQSLEEENSELISKYAEQPTTIAEGVQSAYKTLSQNIKSAGQTILAVPMEVYERSGKEGPALPVIRAVPIAVLKPMIGASEAISKTLMGLHNTLDPQAQIETEAKYKHR